MKRKINCEEANQINIVSVMERLGYFPSKILGENVWFRSPFREERTPSFKINSRKNVWMDYGIYQGGKVLDLVMNVRGCGMIQALAYLSENSFSFHPQKSFPQKEEEPSFKVKTIQYLENKTLLYYLEERKIPASLGKIYLREVYYQVKKKSYFALGFANDKKGYELRNRYFKGCIGSKTLTFLPLVDSPSVSVFEGFMDFLSALVFYQQAVPRTSVIVLNSIGMKDKALKLIQSQGFQSVSLFLDQDAPGRETTEYFKQACPQSLDYSFLYREHKDFNELLMKGFYA